jgi:hypothetical protein
MRVICSRVLCEEGVEDGEERVVGNNHELLGYE